LSGAPDRTGGKPRRGRHRTPEPLRQVDIPDLINIGVFSALYFALAADLIAKAGKYSSKLGILISYVVFANINTDTSLIHGQHSRAAMRGESAHMQPAQTA